MTRAIALMTATAIYVQAAAGLADEPRTMDAFQPDAILALADRVYTHTLENPYRATDRNWIRATFYSGVMELYHATGKEKYRKQAERWAEKHKWQVGTEGSGLNKLFCAMTWAELCLLDPDPKKIEPTLKWLATDAPNSPGGAKIWFGHAPPPYDDPLYSDSLYGAPVFPMLYQATGDRGHLDMLNHVFWAVTEATLDEDDSLYYRDPRFIGQKSPNGEKILWSRGNGWVFAAFPRIFRYLPDDAPGRERYVELYRRMAASLAARQQPDGFWRSNLADPLHTPMPESSGTAFFIAGFAWGVRNGMLDRETYLPVIVRGWKALAGSVHPDGKLGWVQPVGDRPRPSDLHSTHEYAAGLLLSAAGEVYLLAKEGVITPEAIESAGTEEPMSRQAIEEVGVQAARWALANLMHSMSYENMCAAYGILKIAAATGDEKMRKAVEKVFRPELLEGTSPHRDNARDRAHQWFGFIPLELYKQTRNPDYLKRGIEMAEHQYGNATEDGMPEYTPRGFVDDIYGATTMQSLAYACTGDTKHLERAIRQVLFYAENYQEENGLFYHGPRSRFFWGRGNGWCAAAFAEVLAVTPEDHPKRDEVLAVYRLMMEGLLKHQGPEGMWYQLVDDHSTWPETSGTAMFLFAMSEGVRYGWLSEAPYRAAVAKAWQALAGHVDQQWRLREICVGTNTGKDREFYLNRPRHTGDAHGQAPLLWAAAAVL